MIYETKSPKQYPQSYFGPVASHWNQVDDKYQYACESRYNRVHGWICIDPVNSTGFWLITPSYEFRSAGPLKQYLTSHVGPTTLSVRVLFF